MKGRPICAVLCPECEELHSVFMHCFDGGLIFYCHECDTYIHADAALSIIEAPQGAADEIFELFKGTPVSGCLHRAPRKGIIPPY
jgi:hypothetical protein